MKILKSYWGEKSSFIEGSKNIHGEKFTYDNIDLSKYPKIQQVNCQLHGEFSCNIRTHVEGNGGCKDCQYEYISELQIRTDVGFMSSTGQKILNHNRDSHLVRVECSVHGFCYERYRRTLEDYLCPLCIKEKEIKSKAESNLYLIKATLKSFESIRMLEESPHSLVYNCTLHDYEEFLQTEDFYCFKNRISKCKFCQGEDKRKRLTMGREGFITKSREIYKNTFDYSLLEFINTVTPVTLICKYHGDFETYPTNHLRGTFGGCKQCMAESNSVVVWKNIRKALRGDYAGRDNIFYVIKVRSKVYEESFIKVGLANKGVKQRYSGKRYSSLIEYRILEEVCMTEFRAVLLENYFLTVFSNYKYVPDTKFTGYTECFLEYTEEMESVVRRYGHGKQLQ